MSDETAVISGRYENVSYSLNGNVSGAQYVIGRSLPEGMSAASSSGNNNNNNNNHHIHRNNNSNSNNMNNVSSSSSSSSCAKSKSGINIGVPSAASSSSSRVVVGGRSRPFESNREILLTDSLMGLTSL